MRIGILTYAYVPNFGANLQALSTYSYLKNKGYEVLLIIWEPMDLKVKYETRFDNVQLKTHLEFVKKHMDCTRICRSVKDIQYEINRLSINAIIIGSDAVLQDHPFLSRVYFPTKRIIYIEEITEERLFPNPFWGIFNTMGLPMVLLSVSSQNSEYQWIHGCKKKAMNDALHRFSYISVRDVWTQKMVRYLTSGGIVPKITPDPVFSFNENVQKDLIPSRRYILDKYKLPENYCLVSFRNKRLADKKWLRTLKDEALKRGFSCAVLSMPNGICYEHDFDYEISVPLDPLDWYALIRYSSGYIGENMHPLIVALHNGVSVYSFDTYGITKFANIYYKKKASKIYDLLSDFGLIETNYTYASARFFKKPSAVKIFDALLGIDKVQIDKVCRDFKDRYDKMMSDVLTALE